MEVIILVAFLLDLILGDPRRPTHPVVLTGKLIGGLEKALREIFKTPVGLKVAGIILWLVTTLAAFIITFSVIKYAYHLNSWLGHAVSTWLLYTCLAARNLADEALGIYGELKKGNIEKARTLLGGIVGRDTRALPVDEICRATVETVAENTVDGIISPLFYAFIGGPPLAMAFKAASTLDSMVGYKNEKYLHLGWCSARADDLLNYIPARLGGILMLAAATILGLDARRGLKTVLSDAKKHESPNGGIPESITAGVLGVRLGGLNYYFGRPHFRAYMGEKLREIIPEDIKTTVVLSILTSIISLIVGELYLLADVY
jgi:adenosylcobinamide-phosphate synthase